METLARSKTMVNLRKIDIKTWRSPVASQFGIRRLPTVWLYHGNKKVSSDTRDVFSRVSQLN